MQFRGRGRLILIGVLGLVAVLAGIAVFLHLPAMHRHAAHLHGGHAITVPLRGPVLGGATPDQSAALTRALAGVAAIGQRWDTAALDETVALFTDVHREIEWPGVLEPETIHYGPDPRQTLELYLPEQGFSEPGPVVLFIHGNGLGTSELVIPASDGLIWRHIGRLAATFGGIGIAMNYRSGERSAHAAGAEDLGLVIRWIVANIAAYGGDIGTIVVIANAEGATQAAEYLFDPALQPEAGPGVAAAVLASGLFGAHAPGLTEAVDAYRGTRVPLALWRGEFDAAELTRGIDALHEQLCGKYGECPAAAEIGGHNRVSHIMSLGTADTSAAGELLRFYHTVR